MVFLLLPIAYMVMATFTSADFLYSPRLIPSLGDLTLGNYVAILSTGLFQQYFVNSMIIATSTTLVTLVVGTVGAIAQFGVVGAALPVAVGLFTHLGQRDALGPAQALYSLFDTQISLFQASLKLLGGEGDGMWEIDEELREVYGE